MKRSLYLTQPGTLKRHQNTLCIESEDGERRYFPVEQIADLHVFGEVSLNKRLLEFLTKHGIPVHFYNRYDYYVGSYYPREHQCSGYLTLVQAQHYLEPSLRLALARCFVEGALQNMIRFIRYYQNRGKSLAEVLESLETALSRIESGIEIPALMQIEGKARETYYRAFDIILENPDFEMGTRTRRPPSNRLNALLSFGNSLLYTAILSEIYRTHLDPRIGYLHATNFRRFSLNLDVAEVFKPILVDRVVVSLVQKGEIQADDFSPVLGGLHLNDAGRKRFLERWESQLQSTYYHRQLKRNVSYRTTLRLELYKIQKHLIGEEPYRPFRSRW